jgi:RNA polymerase sigma factor (TIGR02999 family)
VLEADEVTRRLRRWSGGEETALEEVLPLVYAELRRMARQALRRERSDHTLQPTALVHEAFLRLAPQGGKDWQNREHFLAVCAQLMRQVLVDHARRHRAQKRGSGGLKVSLDEAPGAAALTPRDVDLLQLDRALDDLQAVDAPRARVVEMRYFAGMSIPEVARALGRSEWEVKKDWTLARAWLARRLKQAG